MFFYLIAFAAALLTIFGFSSSRNSLRNFSRGLDQLTQLTFGSFSSQDEFTDRRVLEEFGGGEERLMKADGVIAEGTTEIVQNVAKSSDEKPLLQTESNESFTFDYRTRRHDFTRAVEDRSSSSERERNVFVPQDMWNILKKTAVPASERKNAETLFEALLQETLRESKRLKENDIDDAAFINKTRIIGEATFEKMMEEQNQNETRERKDHLRIE